MELGQWNDDEYVPVAPLPPHERSWRHPSELGSAHWAASEPAFEVGRWLAVASGAVGVTLAIAILWVMIPGSTSTGVAVESSVRISPVTRSDNQRLAPIVSAREQPVTTFRAPPQSTTTITTSAFAAGANANIAPAQVSSVTQDTGATQDTGVTQDTGDTQDTGAPQDTSQPKDPPGLSIVATTSVSTSEIPARVVALAAGHLVVTTSKALGGRSTASLLLPSGKVVTGTVVAIDKRTHTTVLALTVELPEMSMRTDPGENAEVVSVGRYPGSRASLRGDDSLEFNDRYYEANAHEGDMVLDGQQRLVGLCTMVDDVPRLVRASSLWAAHNNAQSNEILAPFGLVIGTDAAGAVLVSDATSIGAGSIAGVTNGDLIVGIDGQPLVTLEQAATALLAHHPDQPLTLDVIHPDDRSSTVEIVISLPPTSGS